MDVQEIQQLLPHRYPFLLVDRVVEIVPGQKLLAYKNVTMNEPFFNGHFPGHPVMPGVLILEALAQASAILAYKTENIDPTRKAKSEFWPAEEVISRGYAIAAFFVGDVDPRVVILGHGEDASRDWFETQIKARYPKVKVIQPGPGEAVQQADPRALLGQAEDPLELLAEARLSVRGQAHDLPLAAVDLEAQVGRDRAVEEPQRVREADVLVEAYLRALAHADRERGPFSGPVHSHDDRAVERRGQEGAGRVRVVVEPTNEEWIAAWKKPPWGWVNSRRTKSSVDSHTSRR